MLSESSISRRGIDLIVYIHCSLIICCVDILCVMCMLCCNIYMIMCRGEENMSVLGAVYLDWFQMHVYKCACEYVVMIYTKSMSWW